MTDERTPERRRSWIWWTIGAIIVALVLCIGWIGMRGIGAAIALQNVAGDAKTLQQRVAAGEVDRIQPIVNRLGINAAQARDLTSDPVWRVFEYTPWLGANLTAVREISEIADDVTAHAMEPLVAAAGGLNLSTFAIHDGRIDVARLAEVAPQLDEAADVLAAAQAHAHRINGAGTLPPLRGAVDEFTGALDTATTAIGTLAGAANLLPGMLGNDGPRTYLLLMQNNAELRSSGGVPGAAALVHVDHGRIWLGTQADSSMYRTFDEPVLPLRDSLVALFEASPGRYMQNTVNAPDFPTAAQLSAEMWRQTFGDTIDGVIAIDAVAIRELLDATGPLVVGGYELTSANATDLLLSQVYADAPGQEHDTVFAGVAATLFGAVMNGSASTPDLVRALVAIADQGRLRVYSMHEDEQGRLAGTWLAGVIPADDSDATHVAVLVNDTTGAKMNYYTDAAVDVTWGVCRSDGRPEVRVAVDWQNNAPTDAATALPEYVTAGGWWGVPPGDVRTRIAVFGPEGWEAAGYSSAPEAVSVQSTIDEGRPVIQHEIVTSPGATDAVTVSFVGPVGAVPDVQAIVTPMIRDVPVTTGVLACG